MRRSSLQTFAELLRWQAQSQPEHTLFTFLANGETEDRQITYGELDRQAQAVAARLHGHAGERALLLYPPGIDYIVGFFGCLYAGVIAVPAYPPDPARLSRTLPRLQAIAADARASLVLTTRPIKQMGQLLLTEAPDLAALPWLATDETEAAGADSWQPRRENADAIALLQYTSGSTRSPKGVMISHGNLMHNATQTADVMDVLPKGHVVFWLPPYHDMGLIGGILGSAFNEVSSILMSPVDFLKRPLRWLRAVSKYRATMTGGPNFAYDLCVRKFDPEQEATPLDLSSLRVAFNGAEPIHPDTLERFVETFAPYGFRREAFYPCYGLAEGTLIVSGVDVNEPPTILSLDKAAFIQGEVRESTEDENVVRLVSNGRSLSDQTVAVADPDTLTTVSPGQIGEVWVKGPSVAQGYWNQPAETEATFQAYLADSGEGPFLRTGDLGFLQDGELYITGRLKDLLIIHGQNHYPQDIEWTVQTTDAALRPGCGAAFSVEVDGQERLVLVQEVYAPDAQDNHALIQTIRRAITDAHQIQAYGVVLIQPRTIPKTSSGKIQRFACRKAFQAGELSIVAEDFLIFEPSDAEMSLSYLEDMLQAVDADERRKILLAYLRHQIADILNVNTTQLDPTLSLNIYGISSVQAVELSERFEADVGRELPVTLAFDYPTINSLCDYLLNDVLELAGPDADVETAVTETDLQHEIEEMSEAEAELALLQELKRSRD